jgi:hypothetical protein
MACWNSAGSAEFAGTGTARVCRFACRRSAVLRPCQLQCSNISCNTVLQVSLLLISSAALPCLPLPLPCPAACPPADPDPGHPRRGEGRLLPHRLRALRTLRLQDHQDRLEGEKSQFWWLLAGSRAWGPNASGQLGLCYIMLCLVYLVYLEGVSLALNIAAAYGSPRVWISRRQQQEFEPCESDSN